MFIPESRVAFGQKLLKNDKNFCMLGMFNLYVNLNLKQTLLFCLLKIHFNRSLQLVVHFEVIASVQNAPIMSLE
jgi:hypothetical protein